jgi:2-polyprenyl-6-methoxyphenol hydroxylase-like FAD-dependent oxidoreductase
MAQVERILIVGGGIAGLTLATALHQQGFRAELVERSHEWQVVGAGIAVQPNGMRVLRALGLGPAIEEAGTVIEQWDFCDQAGAVLCATDLKELWGEVGPFIGIARTSLQAVLRAGAAAVPARLGTSIRSLTQDEQRVQVAFSDGGAANYDLVVGADGIASTVRALTLSAAAPVYAGQMVWRSLAPICLPGMTRLQFLGGEGCFFGLCPVGDGQTYGFGNVTMPRFHDALLGRLSRLRERFAAFGEVVQAYLAALTSDEQMHCSPIEWVEHTAWQRGRVVLIGDAAHASSPMMGQGGCLAMEDAWVLAESLREAESIEGALETFVNRRRPRVEWVRQHSRAVAESFALPPAIRNATLRERGDQLMHARYTPLKVAA